MPKSKRIPQDLLPTQGQGRTEMKKLYSWTFDDACQAQEIWEAKHKIEEHRGPLFRWIAAQSLKDLYDSFQSGDKIAIMDAIYVCSLNSLPLPCWCEMGFISAYRDIHHYKAKSWDDVFGAPHPKGTHLDVKREEREKSLLVYHRIKKLKKENPSIAIDGHLFETIGQEFGIGSKTKTEEWYYKWKNELENKVKTDR